MGARTDLVGGDLLFEAAVADLLEGEGCTGTKFAVPSASRSMASSPVQGSRDMGLMARISKRPGHTVSLIGGFGSRALTVEELGVAGAEGALERGGTEVGVLQLEARASQGVALLQILQQQPVLDLGNPGPPDLIAAACRGGETVNQTMS
jgi:hypothetical protein